MPLTNAFRRSLYLSLALACACLAYSELPFLPEIALFALLTGGLLLFAYLSEGRWALSLTAANFVGMALAGLLGLWAGYQLLRPASDSLLGILPFPTVVLPYLGPVLMVLIPAKMLRPKQVGDYWVMQWMAVVAVALGCALAGDALFGLLLIVWLVVFVWNLVLFYMYRETTAQSLVGASAADGPRAGPMFRVAGRWTIVVVGVSLMCFLLTPRMDVGRWELQARTRMETGITPESQVDLTRTGSLNINRELACEVYAENPDGTPKLDLPGDQRWWTMQLVRYESGRWMRDVHSGSIHVINQSERRSTIVPARMMDQGLWRKILPDLGPTRYYLTFRLAPTLGSTAVLADPVVWRFRQPSPVLSEYATGYVYWDQMPDGTFGMTRQRVALTAPYHQAVGSTPEPGLGPPLRLDAKYTDFLTRVSGLPDLRRWTSNLLDRLAGKGKLPIQARKNLDPVTLAPPREYHETIARALEAYLRTSGEYTYSMDLERANKRLDPVEDFLYNVRSGHCERFASALTLMLRSQGIPALLILGFKGHEARGDGYYNIRQDHAHAWVSVLVPRAVPATALGLIGGGPGVVPVIRTDLIAEAMSVAGGAFGPMMTARVTYGVTEPYFHWLTLDPTPELTTENLGLFQELLGGAQSQGELFFKDFILGYNTALREKTIGAIMDWFEEQVDRIGAGDLPGWLIILLGLLASFAVWRLLRSMRRRHKREPDGQQSSEFAPFHARLLEILARHGFEQRPSQTAREFATTVAEHLSRAAATSNVADVPVLAATTYYRVRFGGQELIDADWRALDERLNRLEAALLENRVSNGESDN